MTRSGSGSSDKDAMHGASLCLVVENFLWNMFEGPTNQGSSKMVYLLFAGLGDDGGNGEAGSKVRRKDVSELRCLTVKDIFYEVGIVDTVDEFVDVLKKVCEEVLHVHGNMTEDALALL